MELNPFGGNFNLDWDEDDSQNLTAATIGWILGGPAGAAASWASREAGGFDITDPFGTAQMMRKQQDMLNKYQASQEALRRDEMNRRWQQEISNSWAAFGAQRRSQVVAGNGLSPLSANDIYLGGR